MGVMYFDAQPVPDVVKFIREHYKGGTIIDFGCGCGRYTNLFPKDKYLGVDGYGDNIRAAKDLHPGYKFEVHDLETWKPEHFDYLLSSVTMEQLDNLPMGWADNYILIEPIGYKHDYQKIYKPNVDEPLMGLEDLRMMLCKTHSK